MAARWGAEHDLALEAWVVTYEHKPLSMFGDHAAASVSELLAEAGVRLWTGAFAEAVENGRLWVSMEGGLPVDLAVTLPRPYGPAIRGLPNDADGFVHVDEHGRVDGLRDVYACGDMTSRPLKQGGLATQQADVAAAAIAAAAGAAVEAAAYRPVLRAMLLTGSRPRYLRHAPGDRGRPATTRRGGRRTRSPGANSRPTSPLTPSSSSSRPPHRREGVTHVHVRSPASRPGRRRWRRRARDRAGAPCPGRPPRAVELLAPAGEYVERPSSVLSPFGGAPAPRVPLDGLPELGAIRHRGALASVDSERREVRTTDGGRLGYDQLVIATGAHSIDGVPGATTFRGPISAGAVEAAIRGAEARIIFVAPEEAGWLLPLYELALVTAHTFPDGPDVVVVTHEPRPLDVFGPIASDALARLLDRAGVEFIGRQRAVECVADQLVTADGQLIPADAVVSLPRLRGTEGGDTGGDLFAFADFALFVFGHVKSPLHVSICALQYVCTAELTHCRRNHVESR